MTEMRLDVGAQAQAAALVVQFQPELTKRLQDLARDVDAASNGFSGAASAALYQALSDWFDVAGQLPPLLQGYGQKLMDTDITAAAADSGQVDQYSRLRSRLG